jgi:hypothetical protein
VLGVSGLFGVLYPARPWLWALAVGTWIPVFGIATEFNYPSLLALVLFLFDPLEAVLSVAGRREVFNLVSPVAFLGELCLAEALNVYAVARFDISREDGTIVSTIRVTPGLWNIAVAVVSILLVATLTRYALLENLTHH